MACVQYNARAYGSLVYGNSVVRPAIDGMDQWNATKKMNSFIRHDMDDWEGGMDSLLMVQALVGCPVEDLPHR